MYCYCHGENFPRHTQFQQKKLMCGAHKLESYERVYLEKKGFVFDDVGYNISNLNWTFGDLTGIYYIWKNTNHEFVGHNQYRRFWNEYTVYELDDNTLYYPAPTEFNGMSCAQQYVACHGEYGLDVLRHINTKYFKQTHIDTLYKIDYINSCNMFFGHKVIYDKFCEVLFDIMFDVYAVAGTNLKEISGYQSRMIAFLAERVMTSLIHNHRYFFGNTQMIPVAKYQI